MKKKIKINNKSGIEAIRKNQIAESLCKLEMMDKIIRLVETLEKSEQRRLTAIRKLLKKRI